MSSARLLLAALFLGGCVTDATSTLQGEWNAFEVTPVDDGLDERPIALPLVSEVDTADGSEANVTETITAFIDEANVLTLTSARKWASAGQSPFTEACDQVGELTMNEDGAWTALLPEATLGEADVCPESEASCTVSDDGMLLSCDVFYTDMSASFQDTHLDGLRLSFRPEGFVDTGAQ